MEFDRKIFIIMPFSKTTPEHTDEYWTNHYEHLLKPSIQGISDLPVERSKAVRTDILRDIIKNLIFSQIVIADITDLNANVLWELGVRQSFKDGTIIIAEEGTPKPFDISIKGIIRYPKLATDPKYHSQLSQFKDDLMAAITDCIQNPNTHDSHVLETLTGRGTIYQIISHDEILRKLDALIVECQANVNLFDDCLEMIEKNTKYQDTFSYLAPRFRKNAIELLLTTRYLDQEPSFYFDIENYFYRLNAINTQLDLWPTHQKAVEAYIMKVKTEGLAIETFSGTLDIVQKIRAEIENKI
jgi:hypothetical protein